MRGYINANTNTNTNTYGDADSNTYTDTYTDTDTDTDADTYTHADTDPDAHRIANSVGSVSPSPSPSVSPSPTPSPTPVFPVQLGNISTRLSVGTGDSVLIGGFIITGNQSKNVIVRAIGPSLPLTGLLADPFLELHDDTSAIIAQNDNWMDSPDKQAIIDSQIPPSNDKQLRRS